MASESSPRLPPRRGTSLSATRQYLAMVSRRKFALIVVVLAPVVAAALSLTQAKQYQATAQVLLSRQNLANALTNTPDPNGNAVDFLPIVATQAKVARSPDVAEVAVRIGKLTMSAHGFLAISSVAPERDSDLLTFHVSRGDRAEAIRLTTIYADAYVQYRRSIDTAPLLKAEAALDARLQRLDSSQSALRTSLLDKKDQLDTLEALQIANATVVRRADQATQTAPALKRNVALGIVGGIVLAVLAIGLAEALDTRVRSEEEIEERLGLPLLARIPPPPGKRDLVTLTDPNSPNAEAFRLLRVSMEFGMLDRSVKSILMTSSIESEGKSVTVSNLAVTLARSGKRVILVDLDLRRPTLARAFGIESMPGVTGLLLGHADLEAALRPIDVSHDRSGQRFYGDGGGLAVLPSGPLPPNAGEVAASGLVRDLVRELEHRADVILIDAPPMLPVGDALALSHAVDGVIFCVRVPTVTRSMLDASRQELTHIGGKALGYIMTGRMASGANGYKYGYGEPSTSGPHIPTGNGLSTAGRATR